MPDLFSGFPIHGRRTCFAVHGKNYLKEQIAMRFYAPIAKVDTQERMVWGYASTDAEDDQGEIITRDALAAALADYLKFANIREMHQMSAVGVAEEASVDGKGLYVGARIVDPRAWDKVTGGVYKGFSVGGKVRARDPHDRNVITALSLTEISLVDRPANPEAVFDCWKAEGGDRVVDAIDYADPGYRADGRKRYPLDSERHIRAAWAFIHIAANTAPYTAGELDQIASRIVAAWKDKIDPNGPPAAMPADKPATLSGQAALDHIHDCLKALTGGDCCKAEKAARRHAKTMFAHLKEAHDAVCRAGASCDSFVPDDEDDADPDVDSLRAARAGDLMKAFAGEVLPRLDALAKRVEELEAMPLPPLTVARPSTGLSKRDDAGHPSLAPDDVVAALARMSDEERTLALIKAAHANPIRPASFRRN
jgi:phage head maturation protease